MKRLEGKVAVITGGSGGIGAATAKIFSEEGAKVLLVDLNEDNLKKAVSEIGSDSVSYVVADVCKDDETKKYIDTAVERYGKIDILFSNAGIEGVVTPLTEYPEDVFDKVIEVNIKGVWLSMKHVFPVMEKNGGGSIIVTSSVAGLQGSGSVVAYSASKHGVIGVMRGGALEGAPMKIRVNSIHPGTVEGRMIKALEEGYSPGAPEEARKLFQENVPFGRHCTAEEVGQLALFLAGDESAFITGSTYVIDGGLNT
ncbi:MAG: SDR family oxidoreductase [Desulfobacterales bacterium]|jgi:NAD(P)-dependent dehydrogenase (short-subunit alcohol dehydrogenase family)|nr:SDR family oxidoreductase [Desulfobacteraceae bacterium]MBT7086572.1 SDR family oxidoreductase [Desulfobacterales bacterium]MBT7695843.1 SDR family oxidoreductase [Desulfobacterales bacterium]